VKKQPKNPPNALAVFGQARRFRFADAHLRAIDNPVLFEAMGTVCLTLSAFSSELYLKSLLCIETGRIYPGHNLKNLYRNLSLPTRRRIRQLWGVYWDSQTPRWKKLSDLMGHPPPDGDLDAALDTAGHAFEAFRYAFEGGLPDFFLGEFPAILDQVALELRPEWRSLPEPEPTYLGQIGPVLAVEDWPPHPKDSR
jgi:hypothetical protein